MPKGVALWLVKNTKLTNEQIANFTNLYDFMVYSYRLGEHDGIVMCNPIESKMLTVEDIEKCEKDPSLDLTVQEAGLKKKQKSKSDQIDIASSVLWLLSEYPNLNEKGIRKLTKCSKTLIDGIRNKTYRFYDKLIYQNPITLGICSEEDFNEIVSKFNK